MKFLKAIIASIILALSGSEPAANTHVEPVQIQEVYNDNAVKILDSTPLMSIDAEEWLCKYADNLYNQEKQRKMQDNWKGRYIKLTGKISKVHNDYVDGCYITIHQQRREGLKDGWIMIYCYFYDDIEKEKILAMEQGDKITVIGYGQYVLGPSLLDCHIK